MTDGVTDHKKQLPVILNPAASGGKGRKLLRALETGLKRREIPFSLSLTREPGHATQLASELCREGVERILVVGGDGTLHEVANGVLAGGRPVPALAVVPVGTGNDFYRVVGAPRTLDSALDLLVSGTVRKLDVGLVHLGEKETFFVNLLGLGLDVEVLRRRAGFRRLPGLIQYLGALIWTLVSFRGFEIAVEVRKGGPDPNGGETLSGPALLSGITMGPSLGGGFMINPDASPVDGLMDLFFIEPLGPLKVARYIPKVIRGTHGEVPEIHLRKVTGARFSRVDGRPFFFEMDGELIPSPTMELVVSVLPEALPVVFPLEEA